MSSEADPLKRRIWCVEMPFKKDGSPNVSGFGSTSRVVVIVPLALWKTLCEENPQMAATNFEVGTYE